MIPFRIVRTLRRPTGRFNAQGVVEPAAIRSYPALAVASFLFRPSGWTYVRVFKISPERASIVENTGHGAITQAHGVTKSSELST